MSQFIAVSGGTGTPVLGPSDMRAVDDEWVGLDDFQPAMVSTLSATNGDGLGFEDFTTGWWPSSPLLLGDGAFGDVLDSPQYQRVWPSSGCNGRLAYSGFTRDQYGAAVGGCTVRCFRAATGELQSQVTSDAVTGAYIATTPYLEAHFLTVHKAGTIAGASIDTLLPA